MITNRDDIINVDDLRAEIGDLQHELEIEYDKLHGEEQSDWLAWLHDALNEEETRPVEPPDFDDWVRNGAEEDENVSQDECIQYLLLNQVDDAVGTCGGAVLIRESYFKTFAYEEAEALGIDVDSWPATCIDWDKAAMDLQVDYTHVVIDNVDYWLRS